MKIVSCGPKGPLLEISKKEVVERLSPGTIREADYYDSFRVVKRNGRKVLLACPRGKTRKGRCLPGQRLLRIWHDPKGKDRLVRECRSGKLFERRKREIEKILKDVKGNGISGLGFSSSDFARVTAGLLVALALVFTYRVFTMKD